MNAVQNISKRTLLLAKEFIEDESGATAIEYGLIAALIAVSIIVGVRQLGENNNERLRCLGRAVDGSTLGRRCQNVGIG